MKFTLKEMYQKHAGIKLIVTKYLKDKIFHQISKVSPLFKNVLSCDFGDVAWLYRAVNIRHDCVHRAGLDKDGRRVDISEGSLKEMVRRAESLINRVELSEFDRVHTE